MAAFAVPVFADETYTRTLTLTVENKKPVLSVDNEITAPKGGAITINVTATAGQLITWSTDNLPEWLSVSSQTGRSCDITGTPTMKNGGSHTFTITASNDVGTASAKITVTVAGQSVSSDLVDTSDNTFTGEQTSRETTTSTESGSEGWSVTETVNEFRNTAGELIMSADVKITARSSDLTGNAGVSFDEILSVDVELVIIDPSYTSYDYSLDIEGLPDWLTVSGEVASNDSLSEGAAKYHHEFTISGRPKVSSDSTPIFTAIVKVSGDTPVLKMTASKDVHISIGEALLVSLDVGLSYDVLSLDMGSTGSVSPQLTVKGLYTNGEIRTPSSYDIVWTTASTDLASYYISFTNGVVSVDASADAGTYYVPVHVKVSSEDKLNSGGTISADYDAVVTVNVLNVAPTSISAPDSVNVPAGRAFHATFRQINGTNIRWIVSGDLPHGLSVVDSDDTTLTVSGDTVSSDAAKSFTVDFTVSNDRGYITKTVKFNVLDIVPVLNGSSFTVNAQKSVAISQDVTAAAGTNIVWSYTGSLPQGLSASSADMTFTISGTPILGSSGTYSITVIATNSQGAASADVTITVAGSSSTSADSEGFYDGTATDSVTTTNTGGDGGSTSTTTSNQTIFTNAGGVIIASVDIAITASSEDLSTPAGLELSEIISVDVSVDIADSNNNIYMFSMDIEGLPDWLYADG